MALDVEGVVGGGVDGQNVFRRGVSTMIGKGVPSFQVNEINGLKGSQ